jgi:hypothetical protein
MGILGALFGSKKVVETGADIVKMGAKGIDALFYTDEEKAETVAARAELKLKYAELNLEHVKATLGESTVRSMTRRYMAWGLYALGAFLTVYSLLAYTIGAIYNKEAYVAVSGRALELLQVWWPIIFAAGAFYFGVHLLRAKKS